MYSNNILDKIGTQMKYDINYIINEINNGAYLAITQKEFNKLNNHQKLSYIEAVLNFQKKIPIKLTPFEIEYIREMRINEINS